MCKNGLSLLVERERCRPPDDGPIEAGACVKLRLPKELLGISPGYYFALSDREDPSDDHSRQVRLYWNLRAEGAEVFVHAATSLLNEAQIFFKLKVLNNASSYIRCDAGVVYVHKEDFPAVAGILGRLYGEVGRHLKAGCSDLHETLGPRALVWQKTRDRERASGRIAAGYWRRG